MDQKHGQHLHNYIPKHLQLSFHTRLDFLLVFTVIAQNNTCIDGKCVLVYERKISCATWTLPCFLQVEEYWTFHSDPTPHFNYTTKGTIIYTKSQENIFAFSIRKNLLCWYLHNIPVLSYSNPNQGFQIPMWLKYKIPPNNISTIFLSFWYHRTYFSKNIINNFI